MTPGPAIGIDLGTTYSCVAVYQHGKVAIIANEQGKKTTPSFVAFTDTERIIGDVAKSQTAMNPKNTIFDTKRLIGRRFDDSNVQSDIKRWPFEVVNVSGKPKIQVDFKGERRSYYPEEISSMVLAKLREAAQAYLGQEVRDAVITVPAYFNSSQRQATRDAGVIAGLNVMQIINEPTAAAIAYGFDKRVVTSGVKNVLIYDLGGGSFDVSILSIKDGVFEVKATVGDTHLGGEDIDSLMVEQIIEKFSPEHREQISGDVRALRRLQNACEQAKRTLSSTDQASIELDSLLAGNDITVPFKKSEFEELCFDLLRSTLRCLGSALEEAGMDKSEIHDIVLVGGSTRIPSIQTQLGDFFNGRELNKSLGLDEAVASGAAIWAAMLNGERDLDVIEVTPLSLGVEIDDGRMLRLIKRNTRIPYRHTAILYVDKNYQTAIKIRVFEGEHKATKNNNELGSVVLTGISPGPRRIPVEVTFEIDSGGILKVSALDKCSENQNQITISSHEGKLPEDELSRMKSEAEQYLKEDEEIKKKIAAKNAVENFCFTLRRKFLTNYANIRDKVSESERDSFLERVNETLEWLERNQFAEATEYENEQNILQQHYQSITLKSCS